MDSAAPPPVYLLASDPLGRSLREAFPGAAPLTSLDDLLPLGEHEPGVVVVQWDGAGCETALALAEEAAEANEGWLVVLARGGRDTVEMRPLSVGWPTGPEALASWAASGGAEGAVLELRTVLDRVARARHDINNPLTSGMAEAQLLLMDAPEEGEMRDALETIQAQLRRIRDMVADLRSLRRPD